jgi:hypothetical protein
VHGDRRADRRDFCRGLVPAPGHFFRQISPGDASFEILHHEERRAEHVEILTDRDHPRGEWKVRADRLENPRFPHHVVRGCRLASGRSTSYDERLLPRTDESGEIRSAVGEQPDRCGGWLECRIGVGEKSKQRRRVEPLAHRPCSDLGNMRGSWYANRFSVLGSRFSVRRAGPQSRKLRDRVALLGALASGRRR